MLPLTDHLTSTTSSQDNCDWTRHDVVYSGSSSSTTLAKTIASLIVQTRCPESVYEKWLASSAGTLELSDTERKELQTYINPSIGLREAPASVNELQAVVAEHLWYELVRTKESAHGLPITVTPPSLRVTEPGGDGLAIYKTGTDTYIFRLWEIKKHVSSSSATSKITDASKQLTAHGAEYLAKVSKVGQDANHEHSELSKFYAELVSMWLESNTKANAGVAISKDGASDISNSPITIMKRHIPTFTADAQLEGFVISIPDFANLANEVREALWSGI